MFRTFSGVLILLTGALAAFGGSPKIARDLDNVAPGSTVDVIIQYRQAPTAAHHQRVHDKGGEYKGDLSVIKGGHYGVPAKALAELANDPDVVAISPDRPLQGALDNAVPAVFGDLAQRYGWDGSGIGVAVLDSGIADIADLQSKNSNNSRIVYAETFVPRNAPTDNYGHGTHVAGIIAGNGASSTGSAYKVTLRGIAANANLINLRVLDSNGVGADSYVIAAIQRAIQLKNEYNIRVMNLSVGRPIAESYMTDPLCQAVEAAWKAGIVVVVAAGNAGRDNSQNTSGYGTITSPGNDPYVITVGAMKTLGTPSRSDDLIASYSSKGPTLLDHIVKPDLVAPGNRIISATSTGMKLAANYATNRVSNSYYMTTGTGRSFDYFTLSGTSMASPMVSGAAALLLQQNPSLTADQVKARLMKTASRGFLSSSTATDPLTGITYTSQYDIFTVGAGYLDIWAALNDTTPATGTALSPTVTLDSVNQKVSLVFANGMVWGTNLVWGTNIVWGTGVVSSTNVVWGTGIVWGTGGNPSGTSIVWGTNIVWGTGTPAGEAAGIAINGEN